MILTEKMVAKLRAEQQATPGIPPGDPMWPEAMETILKLWKVARAARRWTKATPGLPSIEAEAEMVKALDAIHKDEETEAHGSD